MPRPKHHIYYDPVNQDDQWAQVQEQPLVVWAHRLDHAPGWPTEEPIDKLADILDKKPRFHPAVRNQLAYEAQAIHRELARQYKPKWIHCPICNTDIAYPNEHHCFQAMLFEAVS